MGCVRPLVGSDPPHSMPRMISLISPSVRTSVDSLTAMAQAISPPLAMAFKVPPQPWMVMASTGFPVTAIRLASSLAWIPSQPRPTTRQPYIGIFPEAFQGPFCLFLIRNRSLAAAVLVGHAMAPVPGCDLSAVSVAHTEVGRISRWFRTPKVPFSRLYPKIFMFIPPVCLTPSNPHGRGCSPNCAHGHNRRDAGLPGLPR